MTPSSQVHPLENVMVQNAIGKKSLTKSNLNLNILITSILVLYLEFDFYNDSISLRLPTTHRPTLAVSQELPSKPDDVKHVIESTSPEQLMQTMYESKMKSFASVVQFLSCLLLLNKRKSNKSNRRGLILGYTFLLLLLASSQLLPQLWVERGTATTALEELTFGIMLVSTMKWIAVAGLHAILAVSSFNFFLAGEPDQPPFAWSVWEIPKVIGSKSAIIPTVQFFSSAILTIAIAFSNMRYMLGLYNALYKVLATSFSAYSFYALLPKKLQKVFDVEDDENSNNGKTKKS